MCQILVIFWTTRSNPKSREVSRVVINEVTMSIIVTNNI